MKTYTFDVTKCDKIFDLLVYDGKIIVPKGRKTPPLKQRKKNGFYKFHIFLGYKVVQCIILRDLVHNTLNYGRLNFEDKQKHHM